MAQLIHPELSYEVRAVLLDVYNTLGPMLNEEHYESAIGVGLEKRRFQCETQSYHRQLWQPVARRQAAAEFCA